jgi:hypothetical protein
VPLCDATTQARFTAASAERQRQRLSPVDYNTTGTEGRPDSFGLPVGDLGGLFGNKDATYLIATAPPFKDQGQGQDSSEAVLLARISGRLPLTARAAGSGGSSSRAVGRASGWEVRYVSFSSVDLADGKPTIDGIADATIEAFYSNHTTNDSSANG